MLEADIRSTQLLEDSKLEKVISNIIWIYILNGPWLTLRLMLHKVPLGRKIFRKFRPCFWLAQGLRKEAPQPHGCPSCAGNTWLCSAVFTAGTEVHGGLAGSGQL